jgi:hypothetical protein
MLGGGVKPEGLGTKATFAFVSEMVENYLRD